MSTLSVVFKIFFIACLVVLAVRETRLADKWYDCGSYAKANYHTLWVIVYTMILLMLEIRE